MTDHDPEMPLGWFAWGDDQAAYEMGTDDHIAYAGRCSVYMRSLRPSQGFGALMQIFKASDYLGKRVSMRGFCRSKAVKDWAGIWMRVDGPNGDLLGFYNMEDRPITGTTDWTPYDIVMDVPDTSVNIAFGSLLVGQGTIWCDKFEFRIVDRSTPTTVGELAYPDQPRNLDFEDLSKAAALRGQKPSNN